MRKEIVRLFTKIMGGKAFVKFFKFFISFLLSSLVLIKCGSTNSPDPNQQKKQDNSELQLRIWWSKGYEEYKLEENLNKALFNFLKVIENDKKDEFPRVYNFLGDIYFKLNKADSAQYFWEKGLKKYPNDSNILSRLGHFYDAAGNLPDATAAYEKLVTLNPYSENYLVTLGNAYLKAQRKIPEAIGVYAILTQLVPQNPNYKKIYASLLGEKSETLTEWLKYLERNPENLNDYINTFKNFQNMNIGTVSGAIEYYQNYLSKNPSAILNRKNLALFLQFKGKYHQALKEYDILLQFNADSAEILTEKANIYKELGELQTARAVARNALKINRNSGNAYIVIAQCYEKAVEKCQMEAGRKSNNYYDKLVYEKASELYVVAMKDHNWKTKAQFLNEKINPFDLNEGYLRPPKRSLTDIECYKWIVE